MLIFAGMVLMFLVAWMVGVTLKFSRLQSEHYEKTSKEKAALTALYKRLFEEAKAAGNLGEARSIQMQAISMGIDLGESR